MPSPEQSRAGFERNIVGPGVQRVASSLPRSCRARSSPILRQAHIIDGAVRHRHVDAAAGIRVQLSADCTCRGQLEHVDARIVADRPSAVDGVDVLCALGRPSAPECGRTGRSCRRRPCWPTASSSRPAPPAAPCRRPSGTPAERPAACPVAPCDRRDELGSARLLQRDFGDGLFIGQPRIGLQVQPDQSDHRCARQRQTAKQDAETARHTFSWNSAQCRRRASARRQGPQTPAASHQIDINHLRPIAAHPGRALSSRTGPTS